MLLTRFDRDVIDSAVNLTASLYLPCILKMQRMWYHPDHVHTMYTIQHFLHAMYFRCYNNYMIEEKDNYKVMFYFLSPNVFFFLNSQIKCFLFPQKFCVVY